MEDEFTSGPWTGFYVYSNGHRERMDLSLSFKAGRLTGAGTDPVGPFVLEGRYDAETNDVWWTKTYPGRHDVFYKGCREPRGIWGTWEIRDALRGGFRIWPRGEGAGEAERAEAEVETPAEVTVSPGEKRLTSASPPIQ